jgi:anti-anti-sigma factor
MDAQPRPVAFLATPREASAYARPEGVRAEILSPELAIVSLIGEHDIGGYDALRDALEAASASRNVLVDLARCSFIDSTVITLLLIAQRRLTAVEGRLELFIPHEQTAVTRLAAMTHLDDFIAVHTSRTLAYASFGNLAPSA